MTISATERLAERFFAGELPLSQWSHKAHLRVAVWCLCREGPERAMHQLRTGIRRHNEATGVHNGPDTGYHETLTRFWVLVLWEFLLRCGPVTDLDEVAARVEAEFADPKLPLRFYSSARLWSRTARQQWVAPDVAPLPHFDPDQPLATVDCGADALWCRRGTDDSTA